MKKIFTFLFILVICCLVRLTVRGADSTLHVTVAKVNGAFVVSPPITTWGATLQITVEGNTSNSDQGTLLLFKNGSPISHPSTVAVQGVFTFPELTVPERDADSVVLQAKFGNSRPVNIKLFVRPGVRAGNAPVGGNTPSSAGAPVLDPGVLIYDAIRLADTAHIGGKEIKKRINYYLGRPEATPLQADGNRYLQDYLTGTSRIVNAEGLASPVTFQSILSGAGGLDVTTLVDGLAKFLVARTKQELLTSFFANFQKEMADPRYKDLQLLFPSTYQKLQAIGVEIYQFDLYKQALREAFASDLKNIMTNLPEVVRAGRFKEWFDQHKDIKAIVLSGLYIYNSLANGKHPGEVIADYDLSTLDGIHNQLPVTGAIQTIQQVSYALRSAGAEHYWTSPDSLKKVIGTPLARAAFMALLWIRAENIRYSAEQHAYDSLRGVINLVHDLSDSAKKFTVFFTSIIEQARTVEATLANLKVKKKTEGASIIYEDYYALIDQSLSLLQHFSEGLKDLPYIRNVYTDSTGIRIKADFYIRRAKEINEIGLDVATANYSSAIVTLSGLYDSLTHRVFQDTAADVTKADKKTIVKDIIRYGILMAGVVTAKSSDEVEKAIESVALPAGSSRIKRESIFNISLNAFVGVHGGHETIKNADNGTTLNAFGLTAPVGVAFSWGMQPEPRANGKIKGGKSNGVFLSLIDIGAVTTLRFGDTTTSRLPTIELRNIVSPGIFYSHGFGKCPLSLNVGIQYGPRLRDLKSSSATVLDNGYWRVGLSLLMDIPILNFYNKN